MATQPFDMEVPLSQENALELLDRHYRSLGYRVEQSDHINYRLVLDRGSLIGAMVGGPVRWRHVWVHARITPAGEHAAKVHIEYRGIGRALAKDARALHEDEVTAYQARCRNYRPPKAPAGARPETVLREVFIKEVVRIPCRYCGALVENTAKRCDSCGAPL